MFSKHDDLPYFDETGNAYVSEILRQDAYIRRGGKLSPPQKIKYDNRVAMLAERLALIHNAVQEDAEALKDYMISIEETHRAGLLPKEVYFRFKEELGKMEPHQDLISERERDRQRVIRGGVKTEESSLTDLSVDQLLAMHLQGEITREVLFAQFQKRENAGLKLQRIERDLWGRYRSWVSEQRRKRRSHGRNE
ncbi:MAG TPA: hypothetical protein VJ521_01065 [Acidobacteriota bacterium]|nr:hypothetical protein [Acidobacteriota bacterium]